MKLVMVIVLSLCGGGSGFAQAPLKPVKFEVASIRQAAPQLTGGQTGRGPTGAGFMTEAPDRISYRGVTLKRMLLRAYGLKSFQISGPAWLDDEHYDVSATIPEGVAKELIPEMLQNLLVERFRIVLRSDMKDEPVYVLSVGEASPKLKPSAEGQRESIGMRPNSATGQEELTYKAETMAKFADNLSLDLERSVVDQTGLDGKFDFSMQAESAQGSFAPLPSSLFNAVHELGLQLKPGRAMVKHLVIDKAQKVPIEN